MDDRDRFPEDHQIFDLKNTVAAAEERANEKLSRFGMNLATTQSDVHEILIEINQLTAQRQAIRDAILSNLTATATLVKLL